MILLATIKRNYHPDGVCGNMFLGVGKISGTLAVALMFLIGPKESAAMAGNRLKAPGGQSKIVGASVGSLIVDVNGERRIVAKGEQLTVVRGDLVTLIDAITQPAADVRVRVDIVGFNDDPDDHGSDVGKVIDTSNDLHGGKRLKDGSEHFVMKAFGKGIQKTEFSFKMIEPELRFLEVEVNGERRRLSKQDRLTLSPSDQVRVVDVQTNIRGNENVKHDLVTKSRPDGTPRKEIRFSRGKTVFARIPIDWKGS